MNKPKHLDPITLENKIHFFFTSGCISPGNITQHLTNESLFSLPSNFYDRGKNLDEKMIINFVENAIEKYSDAKLIRNIYSKKLIWGDSAAEFLIYDPETNELLG
jgi:UDP-glucose 4-epimerase